MIAFATLIIRVASNQLELLTNQAIWVVEFAIKASLPGTIDTWISLGYVWTVNWFNL